MKKTILLFLLVCIIVLAGCQKQPIKTDQPTTSIPSQTQTPTPDSQETQTEEPPEKFNLYEDTKGMAVVKIQDGEASIAINPKNWSDVPENLDRDKQTAFCKINGLAGKISAACVGEISDLSQTFGGDGPFTTPIAVFLMEDGSLEWVTVNPWWYVSGAEQGYDKVAHSWGKIPWMENITSLSFGSENDGDGSRTTIYATDKDGLRYNLKYPCNFQSLLHTTWRYTVDPEDKDALYLTFEDFERVDLDLRWGAQPLENFFGTYKLYLAEDGKQGKQAGCIEFDFTLGWWIYEGEGEIDRPTAIKGTFFTQFSRDWSLSLTLWPADGDPLYATREKTPDEYRFLSADMLEAIPEYTMDDDELVIYLMYIVPDVNAMIKESGMSALVTGETTELAGGVVCRNIWLGTKKDDSFTRELLYGVSPDGSVYRYDALSDSWTILH